MMQLQRAQQEDEDFSVEVELTGLCCSKRTRTRWTEYGTGLESNKAQRNILKSTMNEL